MTRQSLLCSKRRQVSRSMADERSKKFLADSKIGLAVVLCGFCKVRRENSVRPQMSCWKVPRWLLSNQNAAISANDQCVREHRLCSDAATTFGRKVQWVLAKPKKPSANCATAQISIKSKTPSHRDQNNIFKRAFVAKNKTSWYYESSDRKRMEQKQHQHHFSTPTPRMIFRRMKALNRKQLFEKL